MNARAHVYPLWQADRRSDEPRERHPRVAICPPHDNLLQSIYRAAINMPSRPTFAMNSFVKWTQYPEDVLQMMRMLLAHFDRDPDTSRTLTYQSALKRAHRILGNYTLSDRVVHYFGEPCLPERRTLQYLGKRWRERLQTAGIKPDTLEIENRQRWALTWDGLKKTGEYRPERIDDAYESGELIDLEDELTPNHVVVTPPQSRKVVNPEEVARGNYLSNVFAKRTKIQ